MARVTSVKDCTPTYTLELSAEEASFLIDIFNRVGGDSRLSRRRIAAELSDVLEGAGATATSKQDFDESGGRRAEMYFKITK